MFDQLENTFTRPPNQEFINQSTGYMHDRVLQTQTATDSIDQFLPRGIMEWTIILIVILFGMIFWWERKKLYKELWPVVEEKKK